MDEPETGKRVALAAVAGAHGVKGEVRLKLFTDSLENLAQHEKVYLNGREVALEFVKDGGKTAIARLAGVSDRSAAEALRPSADGRKREAEALLPQLLVELREEHAGQVADGLRVQEVELHEALDRGFSRAVGVMHDLGKPRLIIEAQALLGAAGEQM